MLEYIPYCFSKKDIIDNGGKEPIMKCVIYGVGNMAYKNADGVYIIPITALKN